MFDNHIVAQQYSLQFSLHVYVVNEHETKL